jgi:hypothetical protein
LGQAGNSRALAHPNLAAIGLDLASQKAQQGGFAGAIAADETDALAALEFEAHPLQQGRMAIGEGDRAEANEWHELKSGAE